MNVRNCHNKINLKIEKLSKQYIYLNGEFLPFKEIFLFFVILVIIINLRFQKI